jgi:hypothetical protein
MSSYISSNENRLYVARESAYGSVPSFSANGRIPAVYLNLSEMIEQGERRDKTGGRTFTGTPTGVRRRTTFDLKTYLTSWEGATSEPAYGPLFEAAMGGSPQLHAGGSIASVSAGTNVHFTGAHGLTQGQAVCLGEELRFVIAIIDAQTVEVNAPFTGHTGVMLATPTITYPLGQALGSASILDCWSPVNAIQRIAAGAAVDEMIVSINADFHEFQFRGGVRNLVDSMTFSEGEGGLSEFPAEPADQGFTGTLVPGHLGQAWLGSAPDRFFTLTSAELALKNGLDLRNREFGTQGPSGVVGGRRIVTTSFEIYATSEAETTALYEAARQRSPISVMFQLGTQPGQLFGALLKNVVPEMPSFDDTEVRLRWRFTDCRAQGSFDDELVIAFG